MNLFYFYKRGKTNYPASHIEQSLLYIHVLSREAIQRSQKSTQRDVLAKKLHGNYEGFFFSIFNDMTRENLDC